MSNRAPASATYTVNLPGAGPVTIYAASWTGEGDLRLLLVHGLGHNTRVWEPLVETLLGSHGDRIREIVAIDLPGHGESGLPSGEYPFGKLDLHQYAFAVRGAFEALQRDGHGFDVLVGHSMGGIITLILAHALRAEGGSLAATLGVRGVSLIAPTMPDQVPWAFAEGVMTPEGLVSPMLTTLLPYIKYRPELWFYAGVSAEDYLKLFFTRSDGELAEGAPTLAVAETLTSLEAYAAASQMGGIDLRSRLPLERPRAERGLLSALPLSLMAYQDDAFMTPDEQRTLASWLSGSTAYFVDESPDAVHCALWSRPGPTAEAVASVMDALDIKSRK